MKKLALFCVTIVAIFAVSSCEKENLGKFNPKGKISKVYSESDGHYLKEQWLWSDDQLRQVEYYRKNGAVGVSGAFPESSDRANGGSCRRQNCCCATADTHRRGVS